MRSEPLKLVNFWESDCLYERCLYKACNPQSSTENIWPKGYSLFWKRRTLNSKRQKGKYQENVWNYKNNNNNNIEMKEGNAIDEERKSTYK